MPPSRQATESPPLIPTEVPVRTLDPGRFRALIGDAYDEVEAGIGEATKLFRGRVVWHLNSTAHGGGVAELLQSLLGYARGAGVDARWGVIEGDAPFFAITKRIHNHLHGWPGDGGELGPAEHETYQRVLRANAEVLVSRIGPADIVFCHDPQTAGLVAPLAERGSTVVWRCHVGRDLPNELARRAWDFLRPYVASAHALVFSREGFVWEGLDGDKVWIVPPSIDAFSPKNQELNPDAVAAILGIAGLGAPTDAPALFRRMDGSPGRVDRKAVVDEDGPIPDAAPLLAQISRWDRLKDPVGVIRGFAEHLDRPEPHLLLAGPSVTAVADDPEGAEVLAETRELRAGLPAGVRERVHLAALPMVDIEENAAIVNAIQRRADVVIQKSLAEGFGLTVAEAMWKSRPVIASRCGGIQDQIPDDGLGILLDDPTDLSRFAAACRGLLEDTARAEAMGAAAHDWVTTQFLGTRHLVRYLRLLAALLED